MSGWIKIHRSITEHWLYTEKRVYSRFEAWNDILLMVNYAEAKTIIKGKVYEIKRGQSILSMDSWGKRWGWDKSKVRRFLDLLQSEKMIELKSDTITTHLTVCNYVNYQDERHADETQMKRKRNTKDTQTTLIKEEEENKEEKEEKEIIPLSEFQIAFNNYVEMRISKKNKPTQNAIDLIIKRLDELSNGDEKQKIEILNQSTINGWTSVYPIKKENKPVEKTPHANGIDINKINYDDYTT